MSATRVEPVQDRSAAKIALIEEIALEHLREVGVRAFSTSVVSERAGISVGGIYRYWPTTEDLIEAIAPGANRAWEQLEVAYRAIELAQAALESAPIGDEQSVDAAITTLAAVEPPGWLIERMLDEAELGVEP